MRNHSGGAPRRNSLTRVPPTTVAPYHRVQKLRLGVSACLLGEHVRWNGGHKRDALLVDVLGRSVEWVPVCPEVELGLGVPRDPIRLVGHADHPRLVVERTGEDLTEPMQRYAAARIRDLERLGLDGYVLKARSPSCGVIDVAVHPTTDAPPSPVGRGLFAAELARRMPDLPIEEEERLADPDVRERFLERARRRRSSRHAG